MFGQDIMVAVCDLLSLSHEMATLSPCAAAAKQRLVNAGFVGDASWLKLHKDFFFFFVQFLHKWLMLGNEAVEKLSLHRQGHLCSYVDTKQI